MHHGTSGRRETTEGSDCSTTKKALSGKKPPLDLPMESLNKVLTSLSTSPGGDDDVEIVDLDSKGDPVNSPEKNKSKKQSPPVLKGG